MEAKRDQNHVATLLGVSSADGTTPITLWANPVTHRLLVDLPSGIGAGGIYTVGYGDADYVVPAASVTAEEQINEAMLDANLAGGGVVWVEPGIYEISDLIQIPSNVALRGAGREVTTIKAKDEYFPTTPVYGSTARCTMVIGYNSAAIENSSIKGITIDGNVQNETVVNNGAHRTIWIQEATNFIFSENRVQNGINWMIFFRISERVWIERNEVIGDPLNPYDQNDGIHFRGCSQLFVRGNYVDTSNDAGDDCIVGGVATADTTPLSDIVISDNIVQGRNGVDIFQEGDQDVYNINIENNVVLYAFRKGINVNRFTTSTGSLSNINITGNNIRNYGNDATGFEWDGTGIVIRDESPFFRDAYDINITDNIIKDGNSAIGAGIACYTKTVGVNISDNEIADTVGVHGIRIGKSSRPVQNFVISNNKVDMTDAASSAFAIFIYGGNRGTVNGNNLIGHTTGTTRGIIIQANNTAGNDSLGFPNAEPSTYINVTGNDIYNFDNGIEESVAGGIAPNFNRYSANVFNTVTTNYTIIGPQSQVTDVNGSLGFQVMQPIATTGSPAAFTVTGAAHTTLTASTEATDISMNLARTVQFATGALTTQRAFRILAPTYAFVASSTITNAVTLSISGPPIAGTNATLTNASAFVIESGTASIGTLASQSDLTIFSTKNPVSDLSLPTNYQLQISGNSASVGATAGISFGVSTAPTATGASIYHIRQGSGSFGDLAFATKPSGGVTTERMRLTSDGNLGLGTSTFGTNATKTLALSNGVVPTTSPADTVQLFSADISAGNASLGIRTETAVVTESVVSDRTLPVTINGTVYKICLKA